MSNTRAPTIDASGMEWDCVIQIETRNDMRLQYTLRVRCSRETWTIYGFVRNSRPFRLGVVLLTSCC